MRNEVQALEKELRGLDLGVSDAGYRDPRRLTEQDSMEVAGVQITSASSGLSNYSLEGTKMKLSGILHFGRHLLRLFIQSDR